MTDRMPPIPAERLTPGQRAVSDELVSGPRGALAGPFVPLLRSPGLMARVQKVGEYLRFESALPDRIKELAILVTARCWSQGYEWMFHLDRLADMAVHARGLVLLQLVDHHVCRDRHGRAQSPGIGVSPGYRS